MVNDTRQAVEGDIDIHDADTQAIVFAGSFVVPANSQAVIGHIAATPEIAMWFIAWQITGQQQTHRNHYLDHHINKGPLILDQYQRWLARRPV
ncbi:MAG: hypothetical protein JKX85_11265 [Phycisphaeraceae bacterium]|nr:hypothetical protein [Phycisphaeraceae bacterium]